MEERLDNVLEKFVTKLRLIQNVPLDLVKWFELFTYGEFLRPGAQILKDLESD